MRTAGWEWGPRMGLVWKGVVGGLVAALAILLAPRYL